LTYASQLFVFNVDFRRIFTILKGYQTN